MSTEFNYRRAWNEWAKPHFDALPKRLQDLVYVVADLAPVFKQDKHCGVSWPDKEALAVAFAENPLLAESAENLGDMVAALKEGLQQFSYDQLREAAAVVSGLGRWLYSCDASSFYKPIQTTGACWKFHHLVETLLIEARQPPVKVWDDANFKSDDYMDHKAGTPYNGSDTPKLLAGVCPELWDVEDLRAANFRLENHDGTPMTDLYHKRKPVPGNHPFCIGRAHFPRDGGMYIRPEQAPCEICGEDYDRHKHDMALFLRLKRDLENAEASAALTKMIEFIKVHNAANLQDQVKVDGFAFPGQFKIKPATEEAAESSST